MDRMHVSGCGWSQKMLISPFLSGVPYRRVTVAVAAPQATARDAITQGYVISEKERTRRVETSVRGTILCIMGVVFPS